MKIEDNKKYIKAGITAFAVIMVCVVGFFIIYRVAEVKTFIAGLRRILQPFIYGMVIAYLLAPGCNWLEHHIRQLGKKLHREKIFDRIAPPTAIILVLALTMCAIWILIMLVIPEVVTSIRGLIENLPTRLEATNIWFHDLLANQPEIQTYWDNFSNIAGKRLTGWLNGDIIPQVQTVLGSVGSGVLNAANSLKNLVIGIIVSVYCLAERNKFLAQAKLVLYALFKKKNADLILDEINYADMMFNGFISGKVLDSIIIGAICFIGCHIMSFESSLLIALIIGITNVIPFFGPFIGAVPCSLLLLLQNPLQCLYFVIFIIILQQVDGNIIGPKILGNTTGLSSFWVLFAILLFGGLWGPAGMVIGVPLWAVIYDIIRRLLFRGLKVNGQYEMLVNYNRQFGAPLPAEEHHKTMAAPRSRVSKKLQKELRRLNQKK